MSDESDSDFSVELELNSSSSEDDYYLEVLGHDTKVRNENFLGKLFDFLFVLLLIF